MAVLAATIFGAVVGALGLRLFGHTRWCLVPIALLQAIFLSAADWQTAPKGEPAAAEARADEAEEARPVLALDSALEKGNGCLSSEELSVPVQATAMEDLQSGCASRSADPGPGSNADVEKVHA